MTESIENIEVVNQLKAFYAPDDGAAREHNADAVGLGFGSIHYSMVRVVKPDCALVVGSRYGFIPACIALALKANGKGKLHFVDANYDDQRDGFNTSYGGVSHWAKPLEEVFGKFDLHNWIEIYVQRTEQFFARCNSEYQYIYLDGNHSYEGVKYDTEQSVARLSTGGILTFHDALVAVPGFEVGAYLKKKYHPIILGQYPGMAIIQPKPVKLQRTDNFTKRVKSSRLYQVARTIYRSRFSPFR